MNAAFHRGEAFSKLENYSTVIVEHLALITWFSDHGAFKHWQIEISAFIKTLQRYDHAKKRSHNFKQDDIVEILQDQISTNEDKESVLIGIEGHEVKAPLKPDWGKLEQEFVTFAKRVLE